MSHTEGLLVANDHMVESKDDHGWTNDGWIVAACSGPDAGDNARRLVACWNACDGTRTESLEEVSTQSSFSGLVVHAKKLTDDRDELVKALRDVAENRGMSSARHKEIKAIIARYPEKP